jgi:hypothetical protein
MKNLYSHKTKKQGLGLLVACLLIFAIGGCAHTGNDTSKSGRDSKVLSMVPSDDFGFLNASWAKVSIQKDGTGRSGLPKIVADAQPGESRLRDWNRIYAMASEGVPFSGTSPENGGGGRVNSISHEDFRNILKNLRGPCARPSQEKGPSSATRNRIIPNEPGGLMPSPIY